MPLFELKLAQKYFDKLALQLVPPQCLAHFLIIIQSPHSNYNENTDSVQKSYTPIADVVLKVNTLILSILTKTIPT